jgi:hypothetical protein
MSRGKELSRAPSEPVRAKDLRPAAKLHAGICSVFQNMFLTSQIRRSKVKVACVHELIKRFKFPQFIS